MKRLLAPLLLPLPLFSCKKDDTSAVCTSGCTAIEGTATTAGGAPVGGVSLELRSVRDPKGMLEGLNPPVDPSSNNFIVTASGRAGINGYMIALYQIMAATNPTLTGMLVPGGDSVTFHLEKRRSGGVVDQRDTAVWMPDGGRPLTFAY